MDMAIAKRREWLDRVMRRVTSSEGYRLDDYEADAYERLLSSMEIIEEDHGVVMPVEWSQGAGPFSILTALARGRAIRVQYPGHKHARVEDYLYHVRCNTCYDIIILDLNVMEAARVLLGQDDDGYTYCKRQCYKTTVASRVCSSSFPHDMIMMIMVMIQGETMSMDQRGDPLP